MNTARVGCVDPRIPKDNVYYWGTPGAVVSFEIARGLAEMVHRFKRLELVSHTDCSRIKKDAGLPLDAPLSHEQAARLEQRIAAARQDSARRLLANMTIRGAVRKGLEFRIGHYHVDSGQIEWLERETAEALRRAGIRRSAA